MLILFVEHVVLEIQIKWLLREKKTEKEWT